MFDASKFTFYLSGQKSILLGGSIKSPQIILPNNLKVGKNIRALEAIYNIQIDTSKPEFTITDEDGLVNIILKFNISDLIIHTIDIQTSGYVG